MALTNMKFKFPVIIIGIISLLFSACSTPVETQTPASPTEAVQATPTSAPEVPTPAPTRETIPEGLIKVSVPDSALQTAEELMTAERPPVDRIQLGKRIQGVIRGRTGPPNP